MKITLPLFVAKFPKEILPKTTIKVFRHKPPSNIKDPTPTSNVIRGKEYRENPLKIQMLSKSLYEQIFKPNSATEETINFETVKR